MSSNDDLLHAINLSLLAATLEFFCCLSNMLHSVGELACYYKYD